MKKLRNLHMKNFRHFRLVIIITLGLLTIIGFGCGGGGDEPSSTVPIFEETFDKQGMWSLSTDIDPSLASIDKAWAIIQNGRLELAAFQNIGCVSAIASLEKDLTVSSDNIVIEIDFPYLSWTGMGGALLTLEINGIRIDVWLSNVEVKRPDDSNILTLRIELRSGNTHVFSNGTVVSESIYNVEELNSDRLAITFRVNGCAADSYASADVEVDYIGIFEIKPV